MITLSISRDSLGLLPLSLPDTLAIGTSGLALVTFNPGQSQADNAIATSRWLSGGSLTSTRREIITLEMSVRVVGSSLSDLDTRCNDLFDALGQFGYTISKAVTGGTTPVVYTCLPANFGRTYNPDLMRHNMDIVTASLPRQP